MASSRKETIINKAGKKPMGNWTRAAETWEWLHGKRANKSATNDLVQVFTGIVITETFERIAPVPIFETDNQLIPMKFVSK